MSIYPPTGTLEIKNATLKIPVVDLQYTSNTAKLEANSNVVTEFSRSKKLIKYPRVALTSAAQTESGYESYFVSQASGTLNPTSSRQAWAFFDTQGPGQGTALASPHLVSSTDRFNSNGTYAGGDNLGGVSGDWIYIRLPDKIQLQSVDLWARYGGDRNPIDATVLGSLNGTNWSILGSWKNAQFESGGSTSFTINSIQYYDYIGFVFEKIEASSSGRYVNFHEIDLYGVPEYDPEAHGTDVTVKSYPNVPNTDWLEVYYDAKDLTSISGTVADLSGKSVTGSLNGDVSINTSNDVKSFSFDGSGDYIIGNLTNTGDFDFTVSLWLKKNTRDTVGMLWNLGGSGGSGNPEDSVGLEVGSNNRLDYFIFSGPECAISNFGVDYLNKWVHIVATRTGIDLKIYLDGVDQNLSITGSSPTHTLQLAANTEFTIGARGTGALGNNPLNGSIANFRIFNRTLTQDEIYQLYAYQKEDFGHGDLSMTLKAGRLGIGTSEPKATLDVRGTAKVHGRPNFTESLFYYTGNAGSNYYVSTYKNRHGFYLNTVIPLDSHIGNYGTGGDNQAFTESNYGSSNELCGSHFDCMVYWLKNAPVGHVHRLNWCSKNGSGGSQTYGQKTSGAQIRLWGYWFHTGTHDKDWTSGIYFNISTSTVSVFYEGATFQ